MRFIFTSLLQKMMPNPSKTEKVLVDENSSFPLHSPLYSPVGDDPRAYVEWKRYDVPPPVGTVNWQGTVSVGSVPAYPGEPFNLIFQTPSMDRFIGRLNIISMFLFSTLPEPITTQQLRATFQKQRNNPDVLIPFIGQGISPIAIGGTFAYCDELVPLGELPLSGLSEFRVMDWSMDPLDEGGPLVTISNVDDQEPSPVPIFLRYRLQYLVWPRSAEYIGTLRTPELYR